MNTMGLGCGSRLVDTRLDRFVGDGAVDLFYQSRPSSLVLGDIFRPVGQQPLDLRKEAVEVVGHVVGIYDPVTNQWSTGADMPTPRQGLGAGAIDGFIYTVGGSNSGASMTNSNVVERYDPVSDEWAKMASTPVNVDFTTASVYGGALYVIGGFVEEIAFPTPATTAVYRYDPQSDQWTRGADMAQQRYGAGSATVSGRILVVGGRAERESAPLTVVEEYTP